MEPDLLQRLEKQTPKYLSVAAERGNAQAVQLFVNLGAALNGTHSPLFSTVWIGDLPMLKLLIELGADPTIRDTCHNATPLQWAQFHGDRHDIIEYLRGL